MAYKQISAMDIYEILTRWHAGYNNTQISASLTVDRKTARQYLQAAERAGLCRDRALPPKQQVLELVQSFIRPKAYRQPSRDAFSPYTDEIVAMVTARTDPVKPKTAYEIICERYGVTASYSSFKRFIRPHLEQVTTQTTCRFETEPGEEIQIDYGVPRRLIIDNLKAGIGTHFKQFILEVLSPHAKLNYRRALALVNLRKKYYPEQLDEAAKLALKHNIHTPKQFERLLKNNNTGAQEPIFISDETRQLVRDPSYFIK